MLERLMIEHCSPTLACIKTANLFNISYVDEEAFRQELEDWNRSFEIKGIALVVLRQHDGRALIYLCRRAKLREDLAQPGVAEFLRRYGYESTEVDYALGRLKSRLLDFENFPHEIGIFLSYPLGDVIGFIENAGQNCKCMGCWKVYCNVCQAQKTFAMYKKCKDTYMRLWSQGKSIMQLTVAA
jgi:hypothetical protein